MKKNPFDRSMFESQARGGDTTFVVAMAAAFLLVGILYLARAYLRGRRGTLEMGEGGDNDLGIPRHGFFGGVVTMVSRKRSARDTALERLAELDPPSVNCTIVRSSMGEQEDEDAGRAMLFHLDGEPYIHGKTFFITTPDGIKAEGRALMAGEGEVLNLWFLHDRMPYTVNCEVRERVRFPTELVRDLDPKIGVGYRLVPLTHVAKRDKRQTIRFSHRVGRGALRVYPQIMFDAYVERTDFRFPARGSIPPRISDLKRIPRTVAGEDGGEFSTERVTSRFKEAIRLTYTDDRRLHVSKPYMDERTNKRTLLDLGYSEVLGLNTQDPGRTIHIRKPPKSLLVRRRRRDPHYLSEGDLVVLDFASRSVEDGQTAYSDLVCQVIKPGIENDTLRPRRSIRHEPGLPVEVLDFSVNGFRFESSPEFLRYVFGEDGPPSSVSAQQEDLESACLLITFYPKLRFTRDTAAYRPDLPLKVQVLGKIVRCEVDKDEDTPGDGRLKAFGVRFMYSPTEYSADEFCWDRWDMIRPFKESPCFKEVHKSLNGLIAHLESQSREMQESRRVPDRPAQEKEVVA